MVYLHRVSYKFDLMLFQVYVFWFVVFFNHIFVLSIVPFLTDKYFRVVYIIFASHEIMHLHFNANITMNNVTFNFMGNVKSIRMGTFHLQKKMGKGSSRRKISNYINKIMITDHTVSNMDQYFQLFQFFLI